MQRHTSPTADLLAQVLTMLCDMRSGYRDRDLHTNPEELISTARKHLEALGVDGDGAWGTDEQD